jgi:hypothetical protein
LGYRVEEREEVRPIRIYKLSTERARDWEERPWRGDHLAVVRNDTPDLQIMFDRKGDQFDIFDIPRITFGSRQITIEYGQERPDKPRLKFEKVFISHGAVHEGEIWFIIGGAASIYSTTSGGGVIIDGYPYDDYDELAFQATGGTEVSYTVGTNANAAVAASWPAAESAKRTRFLCDQECLVRFDQAAGVQHRIIPGAWDEYRRAWRTIYVIGANLAGTLRIKMEG